MDSDSDVARVTLVPCRDCGLDVHPRDYGAHARAHHEEKMAAGVGYVLDGNTGELNYSGMSEGEAVSLVVRLERKAAPKAVALCVKRYRRTLTDAAKLARAQRAADRRAETDVALPVSAPRRRRSDVRTGRTHTRAPDDDGPEPPLERSNGLTTEALASRARAVAPDPKRTPSVRGPEGWQVWLEGLEARGVLVCEDGAWRPTPAGEVWFRSLALTFPERERVAA
jgi:hypothetical protein